MYRENGEGRNAEVSRRSATSSAKWMNREGKHFGIPPPCTGLEGRWDGGKCGSTSGHRHGNPRGAGRELNTSQHTTAVRSHRKLRNKPRYEH